MNAESRIQNSIKNLGSGLVTQLIQMVLGFVTRTIFIQYLAVEYLGVNGLFSNILMLLSIAELGIGSAMMYALYQPIATKNEKEIAALLSFYKSIYKKIAIVVAITGLLLIPFLDKVVETDSQVLRSSLYTIYLLYLLNTVSAYFYNAKLSLFHADQRSYIVSNYNAAIVIIQNLLQIIVLIVFQNFVFYLIIQSVCQIVGNYFISSKVDIYYPFIKKYQKEKVNIESQKEIFSNIKSTALIKIGGLAVNSTDNIILNYFSGLVLVGLLSNYILLIGLISGIIMQIFASLTASIAQVNAKESLQKKREIFNLVNFTNFWIYGLAAILIIILLNDFVQIWIGKDFVMDLQIVIILAINFYMFGMQNAVWSFKATLGFFKQGRMLILITAGLNLGLSFLLGHYVGLLGILLATAIARLVTNIWFDPYIVYRLGLELPFVEYIKKYCVYLSILIVSILVVFGTTYYLNINFWIMFLLKFILCLIIPNLLIYMFFKKSAEFIYLKNLVLNFTNPILKKFKV